MQLISKTIVVLLFSLVSTITHANIISSFSEDFETDLSQWVGKTGQPHHGLIVLDPLDPTNKVLTFTALNGAGDMFTNDLLATTGTYTVSFDYLGLGNGTNLGGFFGISADFPGNHYWVAGTGSYPAPIALADTGTWQHYELTFSSPIGTPVHLMIEDYSGSGGVAGDVYFDNFSFRDTSVSVPEPSSLMLLALGLLLFVRVKKLS